MVPLALGGESAELDGLMGMVAAGEFALFELLAVGPLSLPIVSRLGFGAGVEAELSPASRVGSLERFEPAGSPVEESVFSGVVVVDSPLAFSPGRTSETSSKAAIRG